MLEKGDRTIVLAEQAHCVGEEGQRGLERIEMPE